MTHRKILWNKLDDDYYLIDEYGKPWLLARMDEDEQGDSIRIPDQVVEVANHKTPEPTVQVYDP